MKAFLLIVNLFLSAQVFSQQSFGQQLLKILSDTTDGFASLRGDIIVQGELRSGANYYQSQSLLTLENTTRNTILFMGDSQNKVSIYTYTAEIKNLVSAEEGRRLCDAWKQNISTILGPAFKTRHAVTNVGNVKYGWRLTKSNCQISIVMGEDHKSSVRYVSLSIDFVVESGN